MGFLDQLFGDAEVDPNLGSVSVDKLTGEARALLSTGIAVSNAMRYGINNPSNTVGEIPKKPRSDREGSINISRTLETLEAYQARVQSTDLLRPLGLRETPDEVFSGGIKKGSMCVIRISPQNRRSSKTFYEVFEQKAPSQVRGIVFDKFSVDSVNEPDAERHQVIETFGADFVYFYGRRHRIFSLSGTVLNGKTELNVGGRIVSQDWKNAFQRQYQQHFRGSELSKRGSKIVINLQDTVYTGYLISMTSNVNAMSQSIGNVTLQLIIKEVFYAKRNDNAIPGRGSTSFSATRLTPKEQFDPLGGEEVFIENAETAIEATIDSQTEKLEDIYKKLGQALGGTLALASGIQNLIENAPKGYNKAPTFSSLAKDISIFDLYAGTSYPIIAALENVVSGRVDLNLRKEDYVANFSATTHRAFTAKLVGGSVDAPSVYLSILRKDDVFSAPRPFPDIEKSSEYKNYNTTQQKIIREIWTSATIEYGEIRDLESQMDMEYSTIKSSVDAVNAQTQEALDIEALKQLLEESLANIA